MHNLFDLNGKKAIVVGGAGDLGFSMLEALVECGAKAVAIDISKDLDYLSNSLVNKGYDVFSIKADISDRDQIYKSFKSAMKWLDNDVDILVNAAGIQRRFPSEDFPENEWDNILSINLTAPFLYCQLAGRIMIKKGKGKIINVASIQSYCGGINIPAYVATKGGIGQLTKSLSNDWGRKGINVNAIAPGYMATKLNTALLADKNRSNEILSRIPQGRWGVCEDMKGITIFLASSASDYVNGTVIPVDGGYLGR